MEKVLTLQATIFLLVAVGFMLKRIGLIGPQGQKNLNDLVIYVILRTGGFHKKCLLPSSRQRLKLRIFQVGCYTLHGSLTSPYKAGFLAPESMFSFPFSYICTMVSERLLLCYSDRIAQDFHLIPFSDCFAENSQHFICSIWNYTDVILPHLYINVKEFQTKFLHFLNFSYCSHRTI